MRLMGMPAIRFSITVSASSPLLIGRRKLIKMLTRKTRIALLALTVLMELRKSFQRRPRMENASRKAAPERMASTIPPGVARCLSTASKLAMILTKREMRNNRPMPSNRLMITFAMRLLSNASHDFCAPSTDAYW